MDIRKKPGYVAPPDFIETTLAEADLPTFEDVRKNTGKNIAKRALVGYFFTNNPDRSETVYKYLGMPLLRKLIMHTFGRAISGNYGWSNYRLDARKNKIDAAMDFATKGSVFNEVLHTGVAAQMGVSMGFESIDGLSTGEALYDGALIAINLSLVALQRYNRARMIKRVDEEFKAGNTFSPEYKNWLGLDANAVESYKETLSEGAAPQQSQFNVTANT